MTWATSGSAPRRRSGGLGRRSYPRRTLGTPIGRVTRALRRPELALRLESRRGTRTLTLSLRAQAGDRRLSACTYEIAANTAKRRELASEQLDARSRAVDVMWTERGGTFALADGGLPVVRAPAGQDTVNDDDAPFGVELQADAPVADAQTQLGSAGQSAERGAARVSGDRVEGVKDASADRRIELADIAARAGRDVEPPGLGVTQTRGGLRPAGQLRRAGTPRAIRPRRAPPPRSPARRLAAPREMPRE